MNKLVKTLIIILVIAAATASGIWFSQWWHQRNQDIPADVDALVLPQARNIDAFTLTNQNGQPFTLDSIKGKWTFMFFGYTHCPDVCPTTLAILNSVAQTIEQQDGNLDDVQFVFVSVDPERDNPKQIGEYLAYFNKAFIGATGERDQIDKLAKQMGAMYFINKKPGVKEYTVDHSAAIMLTQPDGKLRALFSAPHIPEKILKSYRTIREHY
jgi:protein SCO1/2